MPFNSVIKETVKRVRKKVHPIGSTYVRYFYPDKAVEGAIRAHKELADKYIKAQKYMKMNRDLGLQNAIALNGMRKNEEIPKEMIDSFVGDLKKNGVAYNEWIELRNL